MTDPNLLNRLVTLDQLSDPKSLIEMYLALGYKQHHKVPLRVPDPTQTRLDTAGTVRWLRWHVDERGSLAEMHRRTWSSPNYETHRSAGMVQQVYVSTTRPGVVKGWHVHAQQTDRFVCVRGSVVVRLCDLRPLVALTEEQIRKRHWPSCPIKSIVLDCTKGLSQVTIPPGVAHGWKALDHADGDAWVINLCSHQYDGTDEFRKPPTEAPAPITMPPLFDWNAPVDG